MDLSPSPVRALFTPFPDVDLSRSAASAGLGSRLLCPLHPQSHSCSSNARWLQGGRGSGGTMTIWAKGRTLASYWVISNSRFLTCKWFIDCFNFCTNTLLQCLRTRDRDWHQICMVWGGAEGRRIILKNSPDDSELPYSSRGEPNETRLFLEGYFFLMTKTNRPIDNLERTVFKKMI